MVWNDTTLLLQTAGYLLTCLCPAYAIIMSVASRTSHLRCCGAWISYSPSGPAISVKDTIGVGTRRATSGFTVSKTERSSPQSSGYHHTSCGRLRTCERKRGLRQGTATELPTLKEPPPCATTHFPRGSLARCQLLLPRCHDNIDDCIDHTRIRELGLPLATGTSRAPQNLKGS